MRDRFWTLPLDALTRAEWEALCDGCGKCCLNKLEDDETGEVHLTRVACRLLDGATCRCGDYARRFQRVPECIRLDPVTIERHHYWLPQTCAYRLRHDGAPLPDWHPLLTGDPASPHAAGVSLIGRTVPEDGVDDDWEPYVIEEPT
ncbi:MAG: YcgN family cysteine cluster protein [Paracoccaceae bacterium]